jgi:hypothetical protein
MLKEALNEHKHKLEKDLPGEKNLSRMVKFGTEIQGRSQKM